MRKADTPNGTRFASATAPKAGAASSRLKVEAGAQAYKVALLGAAGGIGQPTGLLLAMNPLISELALYDIVPLTKGVAADISHCNTPVDVSCKSSGIESRVTILLCITRHYWTGIDNLLFGLPAIIRINYQL
jgi:hypothetical protein